MSLSRKVLNWLWGTRAGTPTPVRAAESASPDTRELDHGVSEYVLRMPRALLERMLADLHRPHPFAHERIGFLLAREARAKDRRILLAHGYEPVGDDEYVDDRRVGARIGRGVIRRMMERALAGDSVLHVHLHDHEGLPAFSGVDEDNLKELVPAFCAVQPGGLHGALLLSADRGRASLWAFGSDEPLPISFITIVGYPLQRWEVRP